MEVGYVGLGAMGGAVVRRLMLTRRMHVFDVRPEVVRAFAGREALAAANLVTLAKSCDVVMMCLPTSKVVREVLFAEGGLAEGLSSGAIVIDQTTGDPAQTISIAAELQERGVTFIDAPVVGGPGAAAAGTLAILCGGPTDAYEKVRPLLQSISPNVTYCGSTGNAHILKLVKNAISICNRLLTYECVSMGFKYGLPLDLMSKVINKSSGCNVASERILPVLASYGRTASLRLELSLKDIDLAARVGAGCGAPMLIANAARTLLEIGVQQIGAGANVDEIARLFEAMAGIRFGAE